MQEQLEKIYYLLCSEIIKNIREHGLKHETVLAIDRVVSLAREIREFIEQEEIGELGERWEETMEKILGEENFDNEDEEEEEEEQEEEF